MHVQYPIELAIALIGRVDVVFARRDSISIHVQVHTLLAREIPAVSIHDFPA